jgi:hypothetical protein
LTGYWWQFSGFYIMGFCLVVLGIFIYNLKHPVEKKFKERTQEQRRERSIERLYSVATTKVCLRSIRMYGISIPAK